MYCRFCGTKTPDNVKFCPECGASLAPAPSAAPEESAPAVPAAPEIPVSQAPAPYSDELSDPVGGIAAPQRGMKWFKFIIYFQLWASMLVNLAAAAKYFTGAYYEGNAGMVYDFFPALQPLDIVMGVFCLALAVYAVVVKRALAKFRAKGPMMYYLTYIVSTAGTALYLLIGSIILGQSAFTAGIAGNFAGTLVMLFINIPYFNNRKHLFVNP